MILQYPCFQIASNTWEINEFDGASAYLLEGKDAALLIDTGVGIGNLKGFCQTKTSRPIRVFLTHNHRDHVGGAPLFGQVHISEVDQTMGAMLRPLTNLHGRIQFADSVRRRYPNRVYPWQACDFPVFTAEQEPELISISDGYAFDLGARTVQCFYCPGHTPGSMIAIDSQTGFLFAGDCCNNILGLGVRPIDGVRHATMEEAVIALRRLDSMSFDHSRIYNGHSDCRTSGQALKPSVFASLIELMDRILDGNYPAQRHMIEMLKVETSIAKLEDVCIQFHSSQLYRET